MSSSKLEFYRFKLNSKQNEFKTFKDFAIEELGGGKTISNEKAFELCYKHFYKSLEKDIAKDEKLKKVLKVVDKKSVNKHLGKKPVHDISNNIIHGVINGGPYGKDRIVSDMTDKEDNESLGSNKSVLLYFYIFMYFPADNNEGFFMIHSNSSEETITLLFRNFISKMFKGKNYNKAIPEAFCPQSFQDEFKNGATLKSMIFKTSFIDNVPRASGISHLLQEYDIKIEAIPKNKNILVSEASRFKEFFSKKLFGSKTRERQLGNFEETKINTQNDVTKSSKIFEWSTRDNDFVPVVYLNDRVKINLDGTPDFDELEKLCRNLFDDEILNEIRPDKNVKANN